MKHNTRFPYRDNLKAAIFDWAGTTVDYGSLAPTVAVMDLFNQEGLPISIEEARTPMGTHKKDHIRLILQMPSVLNRWKEKFGKLPSEQDVERIFNKYIPSLVNCLPHYADLIPGTRETIDACRRRNMKIGSCTGYTRAMAAVLLKETQKLGYEPDSTVCADEVRAGRPEPWMCWQNAINLGVYPMEACVKIGDTIADIQEGLNAGMWTIGVAKTGNEIGLSQKEIQNLSPLDLQKKLKKAHQHLRQAGAHFVVDEIGDIPLILDQIEEKLKLGEKP